jgi:hypothetical protein
VNTGILWEKVCIVWEMTIEEARIDLDIFIHHKDLVISKKDINMCIIGEGLGDFIGASSWEDNRDFFIYRC